MDVTLEKPCNGCRRCKADWILLNLSGKRTENTKKSSLFLYALMKDRSRQISILFYVISAWNCGIGAEFRSPLSKEREKNYVGNSK